MQHFSNRLTEYYDEPENHSRPQRRPGASPPWDLVRASHASSGSMDLARENTASHASSGSMDFVRGNTASHASSGSMDFVRGNTVPSGTFSGGSGDFAPSYTKSFVQLMPTYRTSEGGHPPSMTYTNDGGGPSNPSQGASMQDSPNRFVAAARRTVLPSPDHGYPDPTQPLAYQSPQNMQVFRTLLPKNDENRHLHNNDENRHLPKSPMEFPLDGVDPANVGIDRSPNAVYGYVRVQSPTRGYVYDLSTEKKNEKRLDNQMKGRGSRKSLSLSSVRDMRYKSDYLKSWKTYGTFSLEEKEKREKARNAYKEKSEKYDKEHKNDEKYRVRTRKGSSNFHRNHKNDEKYREKNREKAQNHRERKKSEKAFDDFEALGREVEESPSFEHASMLDGQPTEPAETLSYLPSSPKPWNEEDGPWK